MKGVDQQEPVLLVEVGGDGSGRDRDDPGQYRHAVGIAAVERDDNEPRLRAGRVRVSRVTVTLAESTE